MSHPRSPVLNLQNAIAGAAFRIAPEREGELANFRDSRGVSLALTDGPGFFFNTIPGSPDISTNIASLEFLWCSAHAHLILYDEYSKAQRRGQTQFDTGGNNRSRSALELLNWSVHNLFAKGTEQWPSQFSRPETFPQGRTDVHVANELFLCGVAWIVHHEIAHLRLQHVIRTSRAHVEEKEADIAATRWILDRSMAQKESQKRALGIAAAILAIQGIQRQSSFNILDTHPRTFQRIDYCLAAAEVPDDDEVYAFAACIMQIQLESRGISIVPDAKSYKELFSEYLVAFARVTDS